MGESNEWRTMSPDILKLRQEFFEKYGDTKIFDEFYGKLTQRIAKSYMRSIEQCVLHGAEVVHVKKEEEWKS